jgi:hypothetical protein
MRSPRRTAKLIVDAIPRIEEERDRRTTRFQLSLVSLVKITEREVVDQHFLNSLFSEMMCLGWCMIQVENTRYGFIRRESVQNWVKLSSKRFIQTE